MTFGSLFAGIGGMDLGLERAGMTCSWQVEIDPFARRVLAKHWPHVRRHDDVRTFPPGDADGWDVDLICGGFPCQDISFMGPGDGLDGARSGLWFEFARIIRVLRPRLVLVENVPALLVRGLDRVLGSLAEMGYDAEWGCIPAAALGAPHLRERIFLVANTLQIRQETFAIKNCLCEPSFYQECERHVAVLGGAEIWAQPRPVGAFPVGMGHGVPDGLDRIGCLGNAVVPRLAEFVGRLILTSREAS
jgi:DNA (cytosine-5)-methyltransferase 1